jgi:glutaredoxin-related protein
MKKCTKCGEVKPLDQFSNHIRHKDGKRFRCKACEAVDSKEAKLKKLSEDYEGTRLKEREQNLKRMFKMSIETYDEKLKAQGGVCAICGGLCKSGRRLSVDHNHTTGKIRDLLCGNCNGGLGKFLENPELLLKAADYIRKHNG